MDVGHSGRGFTAPVIQVLGHNSHVTNGDQNASGNDLGLDAAGGKPQFCHQIGAKRSGMRDEIKITGFFRSSNSYRFF